MPNLTLIKNDGTATRYVDRKPARMTFMHWLTLLLIYLRASETVSWSWWRVWSPIGLLIFLGLLEPLMKHLQEYVEGVYNE